MFTLNSLPTISNTRTQKRLGRGYGSGKGGHTSSRGQKGQKTRGTIPTWFEGGQLPLIRRTPFIKGKSRFDPMSPKPFTLSLDNLDKFAAGTIVDDQAIKDMFKANAPYKILGGGKVTKAFTVKVSVSAGAKKAIEAAGGKVE